MDQLNDFVDEIQAGALDPADQTQTDQTLKAIMDLLHTGNGATTDDFSAPLLERWKAAGILPRGLAHDIFKASQRLEGGFSDMTESLLWSFKTALLGCMAARLQNQLKTAVFGSTKASELQVNLGVLQQDTPIVLLYGPISPVLKQKIAQAAQEEKVSVMGVCTDPLLPPYRFFPVTTSVSQEIPLMTGAVDLIVAGSQFVNPSLADVARDWTVNVVATDGLNQSADPQELARKIVMQATQAFEMRQNIARDIPMVKESAVMGYSAAQLDLNKIVRALENGQIKGIAILAGSNNVKYTQDEVLVTIAKQFLAEDILCISDGDASVSLAKYRLLDPARRDKDCGPGVNELLDSLGHKLPSVIDWYMTDFLPALDAAGGKALAEYPLCAYFPEASRTAEVTQALWTVAMGVSTYFWPSLPVTGSANTRQALGDFCRQKFGAQLHVVTQKIDARAKAGLFLKEIDAPAALSGKAWE